jgi:hypothetical protein
MATAGAAVTAGAIAYATQSKAKEHGKSFEQERLKVQEEQTERQETGADSDADSEASVLVSSHPRQTIAMVAGTPSGRNSDEIELISRWQQHYQCPSLSHTHLLRIGELRTDGVLIVMSRTKNSTNEPGDNASPGRDSDEIEFISIW